MLRGLGEDQRPGRWVLWGAEAKLADLAWPGAQIAPIAEDPRLLLGQRRAFEIPTGDFYLFMHHQRPLRRLPCMTLVYDTIALRYGSSRPVREVKRRFLRHVADSSRCVLTISAYSKASVIGDLGVPAERVEVLRFPFDDAFADRVLNLRRVTPTEDIALYVGGFMAHKNLPRLLAAFDTSRFRQEGGRLMLVGGSASQAQGVLGRLSSEQRRQVVVGQVCDQAALDELFASSLFLVQPSLEEGFGLPAWEALCCGLPVCVSDGGALPEVVRGFADPFPATSVPAMAAALDDCADRARGWTLADASERSAAVRLSAPAIRDFGRQFRSVIDTYASIGS